MRGKQEMKKLILLAIPALLVAGCTNKNQQPVHEDDYQLNLSVASPSGAPSVCLYKYVKDESKVEIRSPEEASAVAAYMVSGQKDVIILPTNAGVMNIVKQNVNYKIAANITFGNLFVCATGNDDNGVMDGDDYVLLIQQGNVPDKLFQYCYGDLNLSNVHYLAQASNSRQVVVSGKNSEDNDALVDYVLVAEPVFSAAKSQNPNATQYASLQEVYKQKSGNKEITQASVFIKNTVSKDDADAFLSALEKDINDFVTNPSVMDDYVKDFDNLQFAAKFGVPNANLLKTLTTNGNRMGVGFKKAKDNKANIDQFLTMWPAIGATSEEIYY